MPFVPTDIPAPASPLKYHLGPSAYFWPEVPPNPEVVSGSIWCVDRGLAQKDNVKLLLRLVSCGSLLTLTKLLVPLKSRAPVPTCPVVQVASCAVPVLPLPEESVAVVPVPSSNCQRAATG